MALLQYSAGGRSLKPRAITPEGEIRMSDQLEGELVLALYAARHGKEEARKMAEAQGLVFDEKKSFARN